MDALDVSVAQKTPDRQVCPEPGIVLRPLVTLHNRKWDIKHHIIRDDGCYVLIDDQGTYLTHWFSEAFEAVKSLPVLEPK